MGRIFVIGGGEPVENRPLFDYAVELMEEEKPKILVMDESAESNFADLKKDCVVKSLKSYGDYEENLNVSLTTEKIRDAFSWCDAFYVNEGELFDKYPVLKKLHFDECFQSLFAEGRAFIIGDGEGATTLFEYGYLPGKGFVPGVLHDYHCALCPYYERVFGNSFENALNILNNVGKVNGIAMESGTALCENHGRQYFVRAKEDAKVISIRFINGNSICQELLFRSL